MIKLNGFKEVMPSANEAPIFIQCECGAKYKIIHSELGLRLIAEGEPEPEPARKIINLHCTDPEPEPETCVTTACLHA